MPTLIALYQGDSVASAKLIAVSADPELIADVSTRLLRQPPEADEADPVIGALQRGRKSALRLIRREATRGGR